MKYFVLILSVTLFVSCKIRSNNNQSELSKYKVYKIDNVNTFYFIYCEKEGVNYKIISKKNEGKKVNHEKIAIGNYYNLELINFPDYSKNKNPLTGFSPLVDCFMLDLQTKVCKEQGINGLYTTKNLEGLYFVK